MKLRKGWLVIVDWDDAVAGETGWNPPEGLKAERVRSVGYVVGQTSDAITLAGDVQAKGAPHKDHVNRPFTIPRGMVRKVRRVHFRHCEAIQ